MKFILKLIFYPIFIILLLLGLFLFMIYKNVDVPAQDYDPVHYQVSIQDMLAETMDRFIEDEQRHLTIEMQEAKTNSLIRKQLLAAMNAPDESIHYIMDEPQYRFQGAWVKFKDQKMIFEAGFRASYMGIKFKTRVLITFKMKIEGEILSLSIDSLKFGKLPLTWAPGVANWVAKQVVNKDLNQMINEQLKDIGTFDIKKRKLEINLKALVAKQLEQNQEAKMASFLIDYIFENDVFTISSQQKTFSLGLDLKSLEDMGTLEHVTPAERFNTSVEYEAFLASKMATASLNPVTMSGEVKFSAHDLNRLIDYNVPGNGHKLSEMPLLENYALTVYKPFIELTAQANIQLGIWLSNTASTSDYFQTIVKINVDFDIDGDDLVIEIGSLSLGQLVLEPSEQETLLEALDGMIVDGKLILSDFFANLPAMIQVDSISLVSGELVIKVIPK